MAGTFTNVGTRPHLSQIPPILTGQTITTPAQQQIVNPGQVYVPPTTEAAIVRSQHKDKFTES